MSTGSSRRLRSQRPDPPVPIQWRSWPIREGAFRALLVFLGLVAAWVLVRWITGQTHLASLAMAALGLSLWRFFVPVTFELNAKGVDQSLLGRHRQIPWAAIGRYEVCRSGVLLLPQADRCPIDVFRGLYLPWGGRREEVLAHVRYHLDPQPQT
jgi:hypothetical protein